MLVVYDVLFSLTSKETRVCRLPPVSNGVLSDADIYSALAARVCSL